MGGQQGKERPVLGGAGPGGTITRPGRVKYRSGKDVRGANIFTEHNGTSTKLTFSVDSNKLTIHFIRCLQDTDLTQ